MSFQKGGLSGDKVTVAALVLLVVAAAAYIFIAEYGDVLMNGDASKSDAVSLKEPDAASRDGMTPPDDSDVMQQDGEASDMAPSDDSDTARQDEEAPGMVSPDDSDMAQQDGEVPETDVAATDYEMTPGMTPGMSPGAASEMTPEIAPEMIRLPAGSFRMGDLQGIGDADEAPARTVQIKPFSLGKHEVMEFQFAAFVEATGYDAGDGWRFDSKGGDYPAASVSWDDAQAYIDWLNNRTGKRYRLPTEAEWEYAARAGGATRYHFGDDAGRLRHHANYGGRLGEPASAGSHKPNSWGLYDMHGNAWEWVQDCWHGNYDDAPTDGSAWTSTHGGDCEKAVIRGGAWRNDARSLRAANRDWDFRATRGPGYGFRLAHD